MSANPSTLLVDTNVWLDVFLRNRPGHIPAKELIDYALGSGIQLLYSPISLKDVEYITAATFKREVRAQGDVVDNACALVAQQFAWSCVQSMRRMAIAVGTDESDMWLAEKYHAIHPDFEDDILLAASKRSNADYLVTGDNRLLAHAPVPAITPSNLLVLLRELGCME